MSTPASSPATPAGPAATPAADVMPRSVWLRCVIRTREASEGRGAPMIPSHAHNFGGKAFATWTSRVVDGGEGDRVVVPQRGQIEEFLIGGPGCELERVRAAVGRHVVRWTNRDRLRGSILSTHVRDAILDNFGDRSGEWAVRRNPHYVAKRDDEPLAPLLSLEVVVNGSDVGPEIDLTPGAPFPPQLAALLKA